MPAARRDLDSVPRHIQHAIRHTVRQRLGVNPRSPGALAMRGEWAGYWRIRVGVYRVVYVISHPDQVIVTDIGPPSVYARR